jgi:hypothetical protein
MAIAQTAAPEIGFDEVPQSYRGYFDNADWTLHKLVVAGSWLFLIAAILLHFVVFALPTTG